MTNFTLKAASLLIITLLSSQAFAKSPWAEETVTNETSADDLQTEQAVETEASPIAPPTPGYVEPESIAETPVEPVAESVEEIQDTAEPVATTAPQRTVVQGDVLNTANTQVAGIRVLDFPRRGMTSDKVQNELGQPAEIIPSVGEPPISRWVYADRTIYFEYSSVIHVVAK